MAKYEIPIEDPAPRLAPTAARILEAAKRVLARDGFPALTFANIAAEAGENPALIRYHFGSKAGLITTLVDSVLYLESVELIEELASVPPGDERRRALFRLHQTYARDLDSYQMFYEIVPHILRDEELRPHLSALFDWYRKLDAWALGAQAGTDHPAQLETAGTADRRDRRRRRAAGAGRSRARHRPGLRDLAPADPELPRRRLRRSRRRRGTRRRRRRAGRLA